MTKIKNEPNRAKFNFVDVIIIAVICIGALFAYRFVTKTSVTMGDVPQVSFTVEIRQQEPEYKELIQIGDDIKDSVKGGYFGKVTKVEAKPNKEYTENTLSGTYTTDSIEGLEDVYVTITGTPTTFGPDIMFANQEVKVGQQIFIKSKEYVGYGFVVDMEIADKGGANE